jgi:hypothetical protein
VKDKVALRFGPLVYNIENVEQDIASKLPPTAPLRTEWRPDFLGGVTVITSTFADGAPMTAIPNFSRTNRQPPAPDPSNTPASANAPVGAASAGQAAVGQGAAPAPRPAPPSPTSVLWIHET